MTSLQTGTPHFLWRVDRALTRLAAGFEARGGLSYAEAFAATLARERKAGLLTGDPELKSLNKEIKILWIGRES